MATLIIAVFFMACGGMILLEVPSNNFGGVICGVVILSLGIEAFVAVLRGRRSLLSRIGPLP